MFAMMAAGVLGQQGAAVGGPFNPETDMTWHSLFWAEGTDFVARGYSDTDTVTTWDNEADTWDMTNTGTPTFVASGIGGKPSVSTSRFNYFSTGAAAFTALSGTISWVFVLNVDSAAGAGADIMDTINYGGGNRTILDIDNTTPASATLRVSTTNTITVGTDLTAGPALFTVVQTASSGSSMRWNTLAGTAGSRNNTQPSVFGLMGGSIGIEGSFALAGLYSGDITADAKFDDFESWVTSHYGITIA